MKYGRMLDYNLYTTTFKALEALKKAQKILQMRGRVGVQTERDIRVMKIYKSHEI